MSDNEKNYEIINRVKTLYLEGEKDRGFAIRCGIPQTTFSGYTTGKRAMSIESARLIANANSISLDWLLTGEGPMRKNDFAEFPNISTGPPVLKKIPVVSWVNAGDWSKAIDPFQPGYAEEWISTTATNHPNAFALVVRGDSMEPEFVDGDIITVDPGREAINGSYVIAKNGDEATFKQLVIDGESVYLKPLNQRYPIKDMTGVEFRIIGVVVFKGKGY